ncbi:MAG: DUF2225 domain-containing protein [Candidatus Zixiibacteriota bacterium]|nr:MAG: DUF2225 domain-containing protein [candidate division Zixibacteria bacterium]
MDNPFLLLKIECPICRTINEFEMVRVGAYTEDGRDSDFSPMGITWRTPRYQAFNPLVFFTATCSNCFYTRELTSKYKDWKSDNTFRTYRLKQVKDKHLEQLSSAESIIKQFGEAIDIHRYPNESAVLKLHLAIYDELLAEHANELDLGRFYLRIGWVYRDLQKGDNPQHLHVSGLMHELDNEYGQLNQVVDSVETELKTFEQQVRSHIETDQIAADLKSEMLAFQDRYRESLDGLSGCIEETRGKLSSLGSLIEEYKQATLGSGDGDSGTGFGSHESFGKFLGDLRKAWPEIVTNEHEALQKAAFHYKKAFSAGRDIAPGPQQIQASYMIAELSRRIGDYDEAKRFFASTIKTGQDFIYQNRSDQSRTALARKILELAVEQGRVNLAAATKS